MQQNQKLLRNWHKINCRCIEASCTGGGLIEDYVNPFIPKAMLLAAMVGRTTGRHHKSGAKCTQWADSTAQARDLGTRILEV